MAIWDFLTLDEEVEQEEKRVKSTYNPVNVGMFGFSDGVSGDRYTAEQLLSIPVAKACNDLVSRTELNRDEAIREVYGSLIFGIKGQRSWKFVKEEE